MTLNVSINDINNLRSSNHGDIKIMWKKKKIFFNKINVKIWMEEKISFLNILLTLWNVPIKECMSLCGFSMYNEEDIENNCSSFWSFCDSDMASLNFQSVSPSNWSVLIKTAPVVSVVRNRIKSAGTLWSFSTYIWITKKKIQLNSITVLRDKNKP